MPGQTDIYSLVDDYLSGYNNETAINKLISAQKTKATTSGIITGFGGIIIGNKMMTGVNKKIPGKTLTRINQAVGFRLVTKFGTKGAINLGKAVPVAGAVVGGGIDLFTTTGIAKLAKRTFTDEGIDTGDGTIINKAEFEVID